MAYKRKMRNPEAWIGKRLPWDMDMDEHWNHYDKCDDCQCVWWVIDQAHTPGLHEFIYPMCEADWVLQDKLHVEEAETFCPYCIEQIQEEADKIDPNWRERHYA